MMMCRSACLGILVGKCIHAMAILMSRGMENHSIVSTYLSFIHCVLACILLSGG